MNREHRTNAHVVPSGLHIDIIVNEEWIDRFLAKQDLVVPLTRKYNLTHITIGLLQDTVMAQADIREKKGTRVKVSCHPVWDNTNQHILLDKMEIQLVSKNILVKGAGWFAKTVMGAKLDKKVEQAINELYQKQIVDLFRKGLDLPLPEEGQAVFRFNALQIHDMAFRPKQVIVSVKMSGQGTLHLK